MSFTSYFKVKRSIVITQCRGCGRTRIPIDQSTGLCNYCVSKKSMNYIVNRGIEQYSAVERKQMGLKRRK